MYVSMYVLFCHVLYGCFVCILYAYICMYLCICIFACLYICMFYVNVYLYVCISGIYPSNFDVRLKAQKSQSSNWVFKLNLHKILKNFDIKFCSKCICSLGFFYLKLFSCHSDVKRSKFLWTHKRSKSE